MKKTIVIMENSLLLLLDFYFGILKLNLTNIKNYGKETITF